MKTEKLKIVYRSPQDLVPYEKNARTHSAEQVAQIAASIEKFGFTNPVLIDPESKIIAGHGRQEAALALGLEAVPTITLSGLSDVERRAYVLADNKIALNAGWDPDLLAEELEALRLEEFDLDVIGFSDVELSEIFHEEADTRKENHIPAVPANPVTQPGDIWVLGNHRVMCGDSTKIDSIKKLMHGDPADLVFTDPPYGMSYGGGRPPGAVSKGKRVKAHGMIKNDDLRGEALQDLVHHALGNAITVMRPGASVYVCLTWRTYAEFLQGVEVVGLKPKSCIVWDKKSIGIGNLNYRPQHEFIFYHEGDSFYGPTNEADVWSLSRGSTSDYVHPTQKPVELVERAILNSTKAGQVVIDVFGGSGSTLIACDKNDRRARLMELDPKYCDVIVERWQVFSGKQAVREGDGQSFNDLIAAR